MISRHVNRETGDHTKPVEKVISIPIGLETFTFSVWCNSYVYDKLTHDDWMEAGRRLRDHVMAIRTRMALSGELFSSNAGQLLRDSVEVAMREFVYDQFKAIQRRKGNMEYQVDSLLAGQEYRV